MSGWLVTGAGGALGRELVALLRERGEQVIPLSRGELDIRDRDATARTVAGHRPGVVVNCAAWSSVEGAEDHEDQALRVNGAGTANLALACADTGTRLIHISSDYVFDGRATAPYPEDAEPRPCNAYGRTKLAGERAVTELLPDNGYVLRTAWTFGSHGANFVKTMVRLERRQETLEVVDDQHGQPTWTRHLAERIVAVHRADAPAGVYHATSSGAATWCALAREVFALLGADPSRVRAIGSERRDDRARRPAFSVLGHDRWSHAGLDPLPHWRIALRTAFPALLAAETDPAPR